MGITSSFSCLSGSVGCSQGTLKIEKSPALHSKVLCKGNCFEGKGSWTFLQEICYFKFLQQRWKACVVCLHWEITPAFWTEVTLTSEDGVTTQWWLQNLIGYSQDSPQIPGKQRLAWTAFKSSQSPVSMDKDWKNHLGWIQTCHIHPLVF